MRAALAASVFVGAYALIVTERVHRVVVALAGAGLMLLLKIVDASDAFHSERYGIDWNVIFLLLGMMVIVGVLRQTGVFEFLAIWSAKRARGRPFRILVALTVLTAAASALLDNVTTVLLVAPVTVLITERLGVTPVPFLVAEAMASNIGGTATLVGDPPNLIVGSEAGLSYLDFLVNLAPLVVALMVLFLLLGRWLFREALAPHPERVAQLLALDEREALSDRGLLVRAIGVLAAVTLGFVLHGPLGYAPSVIALLGAGALLVAAGSDPTPFLREIDWRTLLFFAGLFVMVGGLAKAGVLEELAARLVRLTGGNLLAATLVVFLVSGVLSALVDNVPYVATMAPLVAELTRALPGDATVLWWALVLGADLGGNATAIGASANVVILGVAERVGHRIRFAEFLRYGIVVTGATLAASLAYLVVRYFAMA
jgi:Na+/H+ antiporter NhaD/arsenite permease-like protein